MRKMIVNAAAIVLLLASCTTDTEVGRYQFVDLKGFEEVVFDTKTGTVHYIIWTNGDASIRTICIQDSTRRHNELTTVK